MVRGEGTTAQGYASPAKIQGCLKGAHYPSNKEDLVNLARKNSAPEDVMTILNRISDKEYSSPANLMKEVGRRE